MSEYRGDWKYYASEKRRQRYASILYRYEHGESVWRIAKDLGQSRSRINQIIHRARYDRHHLSTIYALESIVDWMINRVKIDQKWVPEKYKTVRLRDDRDIAQALIQTLEGFGK